MGYRSFLTIQVTLYDHALPKSLKTKKYLFHRPHCYNWCFPGGLVGKEPVCNAGNVGLILGSERSPREGHDNPLQYSCLENPMDRGASQATVHRVAKSQHDLVTRQLLLISLPFSQVSHVENRLYIPLYFIFVYSLNSMQIEILFSYRLFYKNGILFSILFGKLHFSLIDMWIFFQVICYGSNSFIF